MRRSVAFALALLSTTAGAQVTERERVGITLGVTAAGYTAMGLIAGYDPPGADAWEIDPVVAFGSAPIGATAGAALTGAIFAPPGRIGAAVGGALLGGVFSYAVLFALAVSTDLHVVPFILASVASIGFTFLGQEVFRTAFGPPAPVRTDPDLALTRAAVAFRF